MTHSGASHEAVSEVAHLRHDLRTPVNQIIGYCEMLLEDAQEPDFAHRQPALTDALHASRNVTSLIDAGLPAGVTVLTTDCRLMSNARRQARAMAAATAVFHSTEQVRAENVAGGQPTAADAVVVWLCSPPHRANILNRSWSKVGCAGFVGPDGRCYWVQQFE